MRPNGAAEKTGRVHHVLPPVPGASSIHYHPGAACSASLRTYPWLPSLRAFGAGTLYTRYLLHAPPARATFCTRLRRATFSSRLRRVCAEDATGILRCFFCFGVIIPPSSRPANTHSSLESQYLIRHCDVRLTLEVPHETLTKVSAFLLSRSESERGNSERAGRRGQAWDASSPRSYAS